MPLLVVRCHPVRVEEATDALENEWEGLSRLGRLGRREGIWIASRIVLPGILKARIIERDVKDKRLIQLRLVHQIGAFGVVKNAVGASNAGLRVWSEGQIGEPHTWRQIVPVRFIRSRRDTGIAGNHKA